MLLKNLKNKGFVVLRNIATKEVKNTTKEITAFLKAQLLKSSSNVKKISFKEMCKLMLAQRKTKRAFLYDNTRHLSSVRALQGNKNIMAFIHKIGFSSLIAAGEPTVRVDLANKKEAIYLRNLHQDLRGIRSKDCYTVWIPLTKVSDTHGTIEIYEGSHKKGIYNFKTTFNNEIDDQKAVVDKFKKVRIKANIGDVIIFNSLILHRSVLGKINQFKSAVFYSLNNGDVIQPNSLQEKISKKIPLFRDKLKYIKN